MTAAQDGAYVPMVRLSIPGNECIHCGTVIGVDLRCSGCGHIDPLTRRPVAAPSARGDEVAS